MDEVLLKLAQKSWKAIMSTSTYKKITSGDFGISWNPQTVMIRYKFEDIFVGHFTDSLDIYQKISKFVHTTWENIEKANKEREKANKEREKVNQDIARQKALKSLVYSFFGK